MTNSRFHHLVTRPTKATLTTILFVVNVLVALVTIMGAYGGNVDPGRFVIPALVSMMLPGLLIAGVLVLAVDLFVKRRYAWIPVVAWVISIPSLLDYSPLNIGSSSLTPEEKSRSFTFLTYNVLHFWDFRGNVPDLESNATIDYILETDADIVSLQEVEFIKSWPLWRITPEQVRALDARYPYRVVNVNNQLTVLSKYPFEYENIPIPQPMDVRMALFKFNIMGHTVRLFNVHLESIGLSMADKELYHIFIYPSFLCHSDESSTGIVRAVILTHTQGGHNFCEPSGIFVIGDSHAAFDSIWVVKKVYATECDCLVVVFLHKAFYSGVYRHDTVFSGICFHSSDDVLFGKVDIFNPEFCEFLRAPSHVTLNQNPVHKAKRIKIVP